MNRPKRTKLSLKNFDIMGIPQSFYDTTIEDFQTYDSRDLEDVKSFMSEYLDNIHDNFRNNKGLLLYGSNGVGKTFLACMVAKQAYTYRYTTKRAIFAEYISAYTRMWGAKTPEEKEYLEEEFYNSFKAVEFLVLEEIGKEIDSKVATPILEDCLRYREDKRLPTIVCTNLDLSTLKTRYGASVFSLMQGNMTPIRIEGKDKRSDFYKARGRLRGQK